MSGQDRLIENLSSALQGIADAVGVPVVITAADGKRVTKWQWPGDWDAGHHPPRTVSVADVRFDRDSVAIVPTTTTPRFVVRFEPQNGRYLFVQSGGLPDGYAWVGHTVRPQRLPGCKFPMEVRSEFLLGLLVSRVCEVVARHRSEADAGTIDDLDVENIRRIGLALRKRITNSHDADPFFSLDAVPDLSEVFGDSGGETKWSAALTEVFTLTTTGTRASFNLMGLSGDFVTHASEFQSVCEEFARRRFGPTCFASDIGHLILSVLSRREAGPVRAAMHRKCHAKFTEVFAPVFAYGLVVGLVFGGQIVEAKADIKRIAEVLGKTEGEREKIRGKLKEAEEGTVDRAKAIVSGLAGIIGMLLERYCTARSQGALREHLVSLDATEPRGLLQSACAAVKRYLGVTEASAFLLKGDDLFLEATTAREVLVRGEARADGERVAGEKAIGLRFYKRGEGLTGGVALSREPRYERNATKAEDWSGKCSEVIPDSQCLLAPILHGDQCFGVLRASRPTRFSVIPVEHREIFIAFACELGMALGYQAVLLERSEGFRERAEEFRSLLAQAAHEFRAPLHNILQLTAALQGIEPEELLMVPRLRQMIKEEVARAKRHVNNYLLFGIEGREELRYDLKPNSLGRLVEDCAASFRLTAGRRGLTIKVDASVRRLPHVVCDYERIEQVFINIMDNAVKYSFRGEPITIRAKDHPTTVTVSVTDRGLGVPKDAKKKIFQGYRRAVEDKRVFKPGTGLGLMIAKQIVDRHEGEIYVESAPFLDDPKLLADYEGFETTFIVMLPKAGPRETTPAERATETTEGT